MNNPIATYTIGSLFTSQSDYVIPIYQRNYTWGNKEITQLIQDIYDYAFDKDKSKTNYYIGTLVVYERHIENEISYETIDGQQRLTTLTILLHALRREYTNAIDNNLEFNLKLSFDSRKKSTETLAVITDPNQEKLVFLPNKEYNEQIKARYYDAIKSLSNLLKNSADINTFFNYLTQKVKIIRVSVPEKTDLNHYFEIMNSRGEQLQKHEVLKAKMLEVLAKAEDSEKLSYAFNKIWEACSDMERYVQYGFSTTERNKVFKKKNWNTLQFKTLEHLADEIYEKDKTSKDVEAKNILDIVQFKGSFNAIQTENDEVPERFTSVISFPNFLLHVLRIQTKEDIPLDDKRLLDSFQAYLSIYNEEDTLKFVKDFGINLLQIKHLFDRFIIKREFLKEQDQWSLKSLKWYEGNKVSYVNSVTSDEQLNKDLLMILSMFHVSTPTQVYKHWLNAALLFLFKSSDFDPFEYKKYMLQLAEAYLYDRYIAKEPISYYEIIYNNNGEAQNKHQNAKIDFGQLDKGTQVENFVFNYLDYILWSTNVAKEITVFEFTFRSSVEHYYPQNPIAKECKISEDIYDLFGNLCLISSSKNSRLSNHMPNAKKDYYNKVGVDSIKQYLMMKEENWGEKEIKEHTIKMKEYLKKFHYA